MENTNIRKNPFGNKTRENNNNNPEQRQVNSQPIYNYNEPPKKSTGPNLPPPKSSVNRENEGEKLNNQIPQTNQRAFNNQNIQNQNNDCQRILEEYENIKWLNSSKQFVRPTTER